MRHWIPMFNGTPCIITLINYRTVSISSNPTLVSRKSAESALSNPISSWTDSGVHPPYSPCNGFTNLKSLELNFKCLFFTKKVLRKKKNWAVHGIFFFREKSLKGDGGVGTFDVGGGALPSFLVQIFQFFGCTPN